MGIKKTDYVMNILVTMLGKESAYGDRNSSDFILFFFLNFILELYNIVLVLTNIEMSPPQVYMCSPS